MLAVGETKSPVQGESFPRLSSSYRKFKVGSGLGGSPNLEFTGNMLDTLDVRPTNKGVEIGHFGTKEAAKSEGHNQLSGEGDLPKRRYLPDTGQSYKPGIRREINQIIDDIIVTSQTISRQRLSQVQNKSQLFNALGETFVGLSTREIRAAVLRTPTLFSLLQELDLARFL